MKTVNIATILLLFTILTSCNGIIAAPTKAPIQIATTVPTLSPAPEPAITPSPLPTKTSTPIVEYTPIPVSGTPISVITEDGITWTECVAPYQDYTRQMPSMEFAAKCLNMEIPFWSDNDKKITAERIEGENGSDLRLVIGHDVFLAKHLSTNGCCDYEFYKNGNLIMNASAPLLTFDPNRNLWNIGGKSVWELIAEPPVIIVDGVNYNEKYQLEGSFFPYAINNKLLYIAKKNGKYQIIYGEKVIGHEFDEIPMHYCCMYPTVWRGRGEYWFWGRLEGTYYVVGIH